MEVLLQNLPEWMRDSAWEFIIGFAALLAPVIGYFWDKNRRDKEEIVRAREEVRREEEKIREMHQRLEANERLVRELEQMRMRFDALEQQRKDSNKETLNGNEAKNSIRTQTEQIEQEIAENKEVIGEYLSSSNTVDNNQKPVKRRGPITFVFEILTLILMSISTGFFLIVGVAGITAVATLPGGIISMLIGLMCLRVTILRWADIF